MSVESTDWSPERKIVGGAIAAIAIALAEVIFGLDLPTVVNTMTPIVVGYFLPNRRG